MVNPGSEAILATTLPVYFPLAALDDPINGGFSSNSRHGRTDSKFPALHSALPATSKPEIFTRSCIIRRAISPWSPRAMHPRIAEAIAAPLPWFPATARLGCFKEPLLAPTPSPWYLAIGQRPATSYRVFRKSLQQGSWRNKQKRPRSGVFGAKTFGKLCITGSATVGGHPTITRRSY